MWLILSWNVNDGAGRLANLAPAVKADIRDQEFSAMSGQWLRTRVTVSVRAFAHRAVEPSEIAAL